MLDFMVIIVTIGLVFLAVPPIAWWFYKKHPAYPDKRYRTFWPRLWASITDALVVIVLSFIPQNFTNFYPAVWDTALWLAVIFGVWGYPAITWFYSIYLHGRFGQTVGKMFTRVRVVNALTEEPITYRHALLRDCVPILISIPLLIYNSYLLLTESPVLEPSTLNELANWTIYIRGIWWLVELITMLTNDKRRAVHDFVAGTVVVRTNIDEGEEH